MGYFCHYPYAIEIKSAIFQSHKNNKRAGIKYICVYSIIYVVTLLHVKTLEGHENKREDT